MEYSVKTVCDRRTLNEFLEVPWRVYRNDPAWVAPLSSEIRRVLDVRRNPYFIDASLKLFMCYRDKTPAARTAVIVNGRHNAKVGSKTAFFGFFESVDDMIAVRSLFDTATEYCRKEGVEILEGPFNPNHYSELGLKTNDFGRIPSFFQSYNPEYYPRLLETVGFHKTAALFTSKNNNVREFLQHRYGNQVESLHVGPYSIRSLDLRNVKHELEKMRCVFNDAFASNWHFLPVSRAEYEFSSKFLRLVTDPELIVIVEHQGETVGVLMFVLDINPLLQRLRGKVGPIKYLRFLHQKKNIRKLIVFAVGIKRSYQRTRVFSLLLSEAVRIAAKYECLETTWMKEDNPLAIKAAERLGMRPDRHFGIYEKRLMKSAE